MATHLKGRMTAHYFIGLWHTARDAACRAARAEHENPGADRRRGFAWVNLPKRSKFTEWHVNKASRPRNLLIEGSDDVECTDT